MQNLTAFVQQLTDVYEHLYDLVYLRTHPLLPQLISGSAANRKDSAWELHHLLLSVIEDLNPGPTAPITSREWRRHRLLTLRYADGLPAAAVADQLAISRRHYYREHESALEAVAQVLWERGFGRAVEAAPIAADSADVERMELLRLEAARAAQTRRYARLDQVLSGVLGVIQDRLTGAGVTVMVDLPEALPQIMVEGMVLRQFLIGMLAALVDVSSAREWRLTAEPRDEQLWLLVHGDPSPLAVDAELLETRLADGAELTALSGAGIELVRQGRTVETLAFVLPLEPQATVLLVDDNEDTLMLMQRSLTPYHYRVVVTTSAQEAIQLATQLQPIAMTIDLMMPDMDGWDVLQTLLNQPSTRHIPIIVCSVLRQKELALSLGATAFLEKPVVEETLLQVLRSVSKQS